MKKRKPRTYWDNFKVSYQMGDQKHRSYILHWMARNKVQSFLDVGCGTGPLYELNRDNGYVPKYKGTDYSYAMIGMSKKSFPEGDFEIQDARKMKENDGSWDTVVLMHSLDHLDDYQAAISEAARIAKRYVIIVLWRGFVADGTRLNDRNTLMKKEGEEPWKDTYLQEYSKDALDEAFNRAGLKTVKLVSGETVSDDGKYNIVWILEKK